MKQLNLHAKTKKKFKVTTDSKHHLPIAPNLLNCDFTALAANQKWCGDISYIWRAQACIRNSHTNPNGGGTHLWFIYAGIHFKLNPSAPGIRYDYTFT